MVHLRKDANGHLGKAASGHLGGTSFPPAQVTVSWTGFVGWRNPSFPAQDADYFVSPTTLVADTPSGGGLSSTPLTDDHVAFNQDGYFQSSLVGYYHIIFRKGDAYPPSRVGMVAFKRLKTDGIAGAYTYHDNYSYYQSFMSDVTVTVP